MSQITPITNYDRFLNSVSINRTLSPLRKIWTIQHRAGPAMIGLGTGTPNAECFPFESVTIRTKDGRKFDMEGEELQTALGYTASAGFPPLIDWLEKFQKKMHDPPYARHRADWNEIIVIPGSEDGQCKIYEMLLERGDPVLIPEPAYPGALSALRPLGVRLVPVEMDDRGVVPEKLEKILEQFSTEAKKPKILVIQPNHCNPTSVSTILPRRHEIYRLACRYDFLILEDDPYYFLTFDLTGQGGHHLPPPSFLSMDTEGRVLRLDSFSKILSGGLRVGSLSGPRPLVERITMHVACSSLHASTFSQSMIFRYLTEFGLDNFLTHTRSVGEFYQTRCEMMLKAAEKYLTGLAEWNRPSGGMFVWMKIPKIRNTDKMITEKGLEKMIMLTPGCYFVCDESKETQFLRASFSWATEEQMNEGFKRLAEMIRECSVEG